MKSIESKLTRRDFIAGITVAGAALHSTGINSIASEVAGQIKTGRIHVFSKALQWLDYEPLADVFAQAGAEGIDLSVRPGGHVSPENAENDLPKAVQAARKYGLNVEMIVTGIVRADDQYAESIIKTAASLGIKYYRMGYFDYDDSIGVWESLQNYKPHFAKLAELHRKYNIHGAYQNHAGTRVGGPVWDLYELLKDLDPQYIGCQYDVRHATVEGGESWVNGFKLLHPWVKCTDLKDFLWAKGSVGRWNTENVPIGSGMVNFDEYFKLVKQFGIDGPTSIHLEYPPFEGANLQLSVQEKKKLFITEMKKDIDTVKAYYLKYQI